MRSLSNLKTTNDPCHNVYTGEVTSAVDLKAAFIFAVYYYGEGRGVSRNSKEQVRCYLNWSTSLTTMVIPFQ